MVCGRTRKNVNRRSCLLISEEQAVSCVVQLSPMACGARSYKRNQRWPRSGGPEMHSRTVSYAMCQNVNTASSSFAVHNHQHIEPLFKNIHQRDGGCPFRTSAKNTPPPRTLEEGVYSAKTRAVKPRRIAESNGRTSEQCQRSAAAPTHTRCHQLVFGEREPQKKAPARGCVHMFCAWQILGPPNIPCCSSESKGLQHVGKATGMHQVQS